MTAGIASLLPLLVLSPTTISGYRLAGLVVGDNTNNGKGLFLWL
jgi:hypothetical protein